MSRLDSSFTLLSLVARFTEYYQFVMKSYKECFTAILSDSIPMIMPDISYLPALAFCMPPIACVSVALADNENISGLTTTPNGVLFKGHMVAGTFAELRTVNGVSNYTTLFSQCFSYWNRPRHDYGRFAEAQGPRTHSGIREEVPGCQDYCRSR